MIHSNQGNLNLNFVILSDLSKNGMDGQQTTHFKRWKGCRRKDLFTAVSTASGAGTAEIGGENSQKVKNKSTV